MVTINKTKYLTNNGWKQGYVREPLPDSFFWKCFAWLSFKKCKELPTRAEICYETDMSFGLHIPRDKKHTTSTSQVWILWSMGSGSSTYAWSVEGKFKILATNGASWSTLR
jgi:hypothetical protein